MKHAITVKYQHLNRYDFYPCYAHILRDGIEIKKIYLDMLADSRLQSAQELIRTLRQKNKQPGGKRFKRLAVVDNDNIYYSLAHCDYYNNIADEYATMKKLKEQLEREHAGTIRVETATSKKDYHKQFKIVLVNWVA